MTLTEMVARVMKDEIKLRLRETMREVKIPSTEPYRSSVLAYLNRLFVSKRDKCWHREMKMRVADKFLGALSHAEQVYSFNLLDALDFAQLFRRMEQLTGIRLKPDAVVLLEYGSSMLCVHTRALPALTL